MSKRSIVIAGALALWLIVLAIVFKISLDRLEAPAWGNPIGGQVAIEVAGEARVGQQFSAPLPGLYRIDLVVDETSASGSRPITFHLKSEPGGGEDLWTTSFDAGDTMGTSVRAVQFPPMPTSKGQTFYFFVESPESTMGDAVSVGYSPGAILQGANAYVNNEPATGNLQFQTFYSLRTRDKIDLLLSQLTEGRSYLLGNKTFYAGLATAYGLILVSFLWQATRAMIQQEDKRP
jgi:hypothetical protein